MSYLSLLITAGLLAILLYNAWFVEDWSRDLTQNTAETSPLADSELLRPTMISLPVDETMELVRAAAKELPRWREGPSGDPVAGESRSLAFVRTTRLMRYQDDVTVMVEPAVEGSIIRVQSKSRVGKGDLGQNPRNIRELLGAVLRLAPARDRERLGWKTDAPG